MGCKKTEEEEVAASTTTELEGTWSTGCTVDPDATSDPILDIHSFSGTSINYFETRYDRNVANCGTPDMTINLNGTFEIGATITTTDVPPLSAKKINITYGTTTLTAQSTGAVDNFNSGILCGISNWVLDVTQDVTGKTCDFGGGHAVDFTAGTVTYSIFDLSGDTYTYQYNDSTSDIARPTQFTAPLSFTKQP